VPKLLGSLLAGLPITLVLCASSSAASSADGGEKTSVRDFPFPM
jgi:hypothetical protein